MSKYSSYILYLLTSILVVLLYVNDFGPLADLQRKVDDALCSFTAPDGRRPNVAIVTIDGRSADKYGQWPWDHDLIGDLTAAVGTGKPKTVLLDIQLSEDAAQDSAGNTKVLAEQITWVQNVVLPFDVALATYRPSKTNNPKYLFDYSVAVESPLGLMDESSSLQALKVFLPAEKLLETKPALGFKYQMPDDDRVLRHQPMVINYEGYYYPSVDLMAAAEFLNVPTDQIKVTERDKIELGSQRTIPINSTTEMFVTYGEKAPFEKYSAVDVLAEGFNLDKFKNKLVLITVDDPDYTLFFDTPTQKGMPEYIARASVIENIINDNLIERRDDMAGITMLALFIIGGICAFILARISLLYRMIILVGAMIVLANVNYLFLTSFRMLIETVFIGFELLLFMLVAPVLDTSLFAGESIPRKDAKTTLPKVEVKKDKHPAAETPVKERFIGSNANDPENLPTSVIETSSGPDAKQAFVKTTSESKVADHQSINIDGVNFDHEEKPAKKAVAEESTSALDAETLEEAMSGQMDDSGSVGLSSSSGVELEEGSQTPIPGRSGPLTQLGRYQITGTLGKGAMGHVYKGVDPAINRPVALKTIRLDFINDQDEMAELKERLHREAQAAGKLSHPNIVTIYDVGSDGSLQYIAMEYLEGKTLEDMIKKKTKFNYRIIAQIIQQICSALQYAHDQDIVHRDIKPANIMITKDYRVKVMDFGIARIDSNSMTKTGIAMGTPNYISPEQLQGKPVDRRADIFSLGVVLYELLIGRRPFKGENITSLIYAILHNEPEKPSNLVPAIPFLFDQIIAKALAKDPSQRYQSVKELSDQLSAFIEAFAAK